MTASGPCLYCATALSQRQQYCRYCTENVEKKKARSTFFSMLMVGGAGSFAVLVYFFLTLAVV